VCVCARSLFLSIFILFALYILPSIYILSVLIINPEEEEKSKELYVLAYPVDYKSRRDL
jgi:hypothetical protein